MKRFVIGFLVGVGLMYCYLHNGEAVQTDISQWFKRSASNYSEDSQHKAAREALGESEHSR